MPQPNQTSQFFKYDMHIYTSFIHTGPSASKCFPHSFFRISFKRHLHVLQRPVSLSRCFTCLYKSVLLKSSYSVTICVLSLTLFPPRCGFLESEDHILLIFASSEPHKGFLVYNIYSVSDLYKNGEIRAKVPVLSLKKVKGKA